MILLVTYTAKPHCREAFLRAVQENSLQEIVRQEDGCLEYAYYAAVADAEKILQGDLLDSVQNLISMYHEAYW